MNGIERPEGSAMKALHPAVYLMTALAVVWVLVVAGATFFALAGNLLYEGVLVVFSIVAIGLPALLWQVYRHSRRAPRRESLRDWLGCRLEIFTGTIAAKEAALQVLLIPGATVVALTLIALIDVAQHQMH